MAQLLSCQKVWSKPTMRANFHLSSFHREFSSKINHSYQVKKTVLHPETSNYEVWVGLETHAQITSKSKLFSGASTSFHAPPNSCAALFDAAIPGTLPRLNKHCVDQAVLTGVALGGSPQLASHFDRKHYFYCDMPLGYQITQNTSPIVLGGSVSLDSLLPNNQKRTVRISRLQLEQDSGKSLHDVSPGKSHIDLNRAGSALMEIVTEPDLRSAEEAAVYLRKLQNLLRCVGTSTGNMEDGSFRCDVNVTVRRISPPGKMTGRVEIKNMMSFRSIMRAIDYEVQRQIGLEENGEIVERETRQWDVKGQKTYRLRKKEDLLDYRFLPEPDLPQVLLNPDYLQRVEKLLPELPDQTFARLTEVYGLKQEDANIILAEQGASTFFSQLVSGDQHPTKDSTVQRSPKICNNWLTSELFGRIRKTRAEASSSLNTVNVNDIVDGEHDPRTVPLLVDCPIEPSRLGQLIDLVTAGNISGKQAKVLLDIMFTDGRLPEVIASEKKMVMDSDPVRLHAICQQIVDLYPDEVEKVHQGRDHIFKFLCGQGLKLSQKQKTQQGELLGEANPQKLAEIMKQLVDSLVVQ